MLSIPNDINHFLWWDDHGAHGSGSVGTSPNRWLLLSWPRCADVLIAAVPGVRMANWIPEYPSSGRSKTKKSLRCLVSHPSGKRWVCLKIGYIPSYSHLIGIMIINHWVWGYTIFRHTHVSFATVPSLSTSGNTTKTAQSATIRHLGRLAGNGAPGKHLKPGLMTYLRNINIYI